MTTSLRILIILVAWLASCADQMPTNEPKEPYLTSPVTGNGNGVEFVAGVVSSVVASSVYHDVEFWVVDSHCSIPLVQNNLDVLIEGKLADGTIDKSYYAFTQPVLKIRRKFAGSTSYFVSLFRGDPSKVLFSEPLSTGMNPIQVAMKVNCASG